MTDFTNFICEEQKTDDLESTFLNKRCRADSVSLHIPLRVGCSLQINISLWDSQIC